MLPDQLQDLHSPYSYSSRDSYRSVAPCVPTFLDIRSPDEEPLAEQIGFIFDVQVD